MDDEGTISMIGTAGVARDEIQSPRSHHNFISKIALLN